MNLNSKTLGLILSEVKPYRRRFSITGVLILVLSSIVWVRPALIQHAVDVEMANGDYQGMLNEDVYDRHLSFCVCVPTGFL